MEEKDFEKKPKKKVGLIITVVILVLILLGAGAFAYSKLVLNKPQRIFEKAISKAFEMSEKETKNEGKLNIELSASLNSKNQDMMMANVYLQMVKLNLTTEFNMDKKVLNQGISVIAFDEPVISVEGLIQDNNIYFLLNNIYSKYIQIPNEEMEGIEPREIFNAENFEVSSEIVKELKQLLLDEVNSKELTQENVEIDEERLTKTTLKLTAKELENIIQKLTVELYKTNTAKEIKNFVDEIEYIDTDESENNMEIAIYTKRLTGKFVKAEFAMINEEYEEAIVSTITKKEKDKIEIKFGINEDSTDVDETTDICTITIKEDSKNKGTISIKVNLDATSSATITAKYSIDYNAKVEAKNVKNSINANDLTEKDLEEMRANIENNEILYSIIQSFSTADLFEQAEESAERFKEQEDYYDIQENILNPEFTEEI